ncbi:MAG: hypothetical protein IID32_01995, partial [Planctomycetes bacterium]|nr:hypothetical protein [Planctomycetota bacterium]
MFKNRSFSLIISFAFFFGMAGISFATERHVPSQYATIQEAIDASSSVDTVLVYTGVYSGIVLSAAESGLTLIASAWSTNSNNSITEFIGGGTFAMNIEGGNNITVHGFTFSGAAARGVQI